MLQSVVPMPVDPKPKLLYVRNLSGHEELAISKTYWKKFSVTVNTALTYLGYTVVATYLSIFLLVGGVILINFVVPDTLYGGKLKRVQEGMTKAEVRSAIGSPQSRFDIEDGVEQDGSYWVYSFPLCLSWIEVQFDEHNKVAWADIDD
jgi:hypothetical protein